ncbi:hypothetical protein J6590_103860 [Homalodisca vitripennis]|nr:hypothetical protein J6590_103860 [Homalodisca vitripennis]
MSTRVLTVNWPTFIDNNTGKQSECDLRFKSGSLRCQNDAGGFVFSFFVLRLRLFWIPSDDRFHKSSLQQHQISDAVRYLKVIKNIAGLPGQTLIHNPALKLDLKKDTISKRNVYENPEVADALSRYPTDTSTCDPVAGSTVGCSAANYISNNSRRQLSLNGKSVRLEDETHYSDGRSINGVSEAGGRLNDTVIEGYFRLIERRNQEGMYGFPTVLGLDTFYMKDLEVGHFNRAARRFRKVNPFDIDLILIPLHLPTGIRHWVLMLSIPTANGSRLSIHWAALTSQQ